MNELQQLSNPDNVPGAVTTGYQRQNTNIFAIQTGLDTTEPFDNGNGLITVPAGGVIEVNGVMFKIVTDVALTKPDANTAYWVEVIDNGDETATFNLTTRPGKWNPSKQGCYTENNNRTLNWVSLGNFNESTNLPIRTTTNTIGEIWQLELGWYLFKASNKGWSVFSSNGSFTKNYFYRDSIIQINSPSNVNINYDDIYIHFLIKDLPQITTSGPAYHVSQIFNDKLYLPGPAVRDTHMMIFDLINKKFRIIEFLDNPLSTQSHPLRTLQIFNDYLYLPLMLTNQMVIFDLITETSRTVTLPNANNIDTSQIYNDRLYLPGTTGTNQMVIFDLINETSRIVTLPNTIFRSTSQIYNDRLYLPPGTSGANQMVIFDLINETSRIVTLPNGNNHISISHIYNDRLYFPLFNQMIIFDLINESIRTVTLPNIQIGPSQIFDDKLYLPSAGGNASPEMVIFDLINETFITIQIPNNDFRRTSQIFNDKMYMIGRFNISIFDLSVDLNSSLECYKL